MTIFKCKMCGGSLEIGAGETIAVCEYCGTKQTLPKLNDEKRLQLYDRANHFRRENEFDKAMGIYEMILGEDKQDAEAYWGIVLCRYGIEYVEDPATGKRIPTVNRAQFTSIFDDEDYQDALRFADSAQKEIYKAEAAAIDELQKDILEISNKEDPFDIFICYKESDELGERTQDSVYAQDIYDALTKEGYKVFFSRITLEDKLGSAYEPYIFAALNSAKVMLVVGTKQAHFNAVWVKNEWSRYLSLIKTGKDKTLIPVYKNISPYDMPEEFQYLQSQDMGKVGYLQDLVRGIKKIVDVGTVTVTQTVGTTSVIVDTMLKRASDALSQFDWQKASRCYDNVLDYDDKNEQAMIGKMLINFKVPTLELLKQTATTIANDQYYIYLVRNGSRQTAKQLMELENAIQERIREEKQREAAKKKAASAKTAKIIGICAAVAVLVIGASMLYTNVIKPATIYKKACSLQQSGEYTSAVGVFTELGEYKDSREQILQTYYMQTQNYMDEGRYQDALDVLASAPLLQEQYLDSAQLKIQCYLQMAQQSYDQGDYNGAISALQAISDNPEAAQLQAQSYYKIAKDAYDQGHYDVAVSGFEALGDYSDAAQLKLECYYQMGLQAYEAGDLDQAIAHYEAAGDYEDAAQLVQSVTYEAGGVSFDGGDYVKAVEYFSRISDYEDAGERVNKAKYAYCDATQDDPTDTTKSYIRELMDIEYKGASKLAGSIFAWKATVRVEMNMRVGTQTQVGIHVDLRGGDGGTTTVRYAITVAGENQNYCDEKQYGAGETASAYLGHPYMDLLLQKFNVKVYDDEGNLIGSFSGYPEDF